MSGLGLEPNFRLDGRSALVTGAAGGIGAAIAAGLAACGAAVGCLDRTDDMLAALVESIGAAGGRVLALCADVLDDAELAGAVAAVEAEFAMPLTLAVNCAGIHSAAAAETMDQATWRALLDVNLTGVFLSCQAEGSAMLRAGGGSIVNLGSVSGTIANRGLKQVHYNSAKAAVAQLSRSLALEWAKRGVRVNTVSPGYVRTGMARRVQASRTPEDFLDDIPLRRMADPTEVVGPVVFLLSEAASYCTGAELLVDGGLVGW